MNRITVTTHQHALAVAEARRGFTEAHARLDLQLRAIKAGSPFQVSYVEHLLQFTGQALQKLATAEEQARKGAAA